MECKLLYKRVNLKPPRRQVNCLAGIMHALHQFLLFHVLTCLGQNAHGSVIIHGKKVPENSMLYMASVQNSAKKHVCGGFLINENFVLTAAHCDEEVPTSVVLGTHDLTKADDSMRYSITKFKYPLYQDVPYGNDLMLLKLSRNVGLNDRVQTIPLPKDEINMMENVECSVAGWGYTETNKLEQRIVDELRVVDVSIINQDVCKKIWGGLPDNVICAGGYETKKGFCQGDSGGPLVYDGVAVGVVSFNHNRNCSYPHFPNVYMDISKYLGWINDTLKKKE
ncbi:duodenase-1-like [Sander lucioperca]|uniref:Peptidase S1 domain-containing protein n=1 Tax=Sander lucioperca TaxID=283035 RepID=A0A8C9Z0J7_SANLU|nr:duodenase-1-like [Sander lucioperca]